MKEFTVDNVVNRRGFLAKAVAASAAVVVPIALARPSKRAEMAGALHAAVSQFDEYGPSHVQVCNDGRSLNLAMDVLVDSSVEEIEQLLLPLFGGAA